VPAGRLACPLALGTWVHTVHRTPPVLQRVQVAPGSTRGPRRRNRIGSAERVRAMPPAPRPRSGGGARLPGVLPHGSPWPGHRPPPAQFPLGPGPVWGRHLGCEPGPNPAQEGDGQAVRRGRTTPGTQTPGAANKDHLGSPNRTCAVQDLRSSDLKVGRVVDVGGSGGRQPLAGRPTYGVSVRHNRLMKQGDRRITGRRSAFGSLE